MQQIISPAMSHLLQVKMLQGMIDLKEITLAHLPLRFKCFIDLILQATPSETEEHGLTLS